MNMSSHEYSADYLRLHRLKLQHLHEANRLKELEAFVTGLADFKTTHRKIISDTLRLADHMFYAGAVAAKDLSDWQKTHEQTTSQIQQLEITLNEANPQPQPPPPSITIPTP